MNNDNACLNEALIIALFYDLILDYKTWKINKTRSKAINNRKKHV